MAGLQYFTVLSEIVGAGIAGVFFARNVFGLIRLA